MCVSCFRTSLAAGGGLEPVLLLVLSSTTSTALSIKLAASLTAYTLQTSPFPLKVCCLAQPDHNRQHGVQSFPSQPSYSIGHQAALPCSIREASAAVRLAQRQHCQRGCGLYHVSMRGALLCSSRAYGCVMRAAVPMPVCSARDMLQPAATAAAVLQHLLVSCMVHRSRCEGTYKGELAGPARSCCLLHQQEHTNMPHSAAPHARMQHMPPNDITHVPPLLPLSLCLRWCSMAVASR
jgi:hypothetical protein